ncbi:Signal recognition particle receptor FtsY [uncultured Desulfobacterium sp.]|uniref:Signal recognition particle receptor FtsY n=1 Tax=uncultured Desulfobacterium sp. TaxID=201089 RepID=A0A445MZ80_9BACT|nr:Signal recognition particle receptor FtsY [uncultured Desulfobacterium sp.]
MISFFGNKNKDKNGEPQQGGLFQRLQQGLSKTRASFAGKLDRVFLGKKEITPDVLDELEEVLFTSDIGVETTQELLNSIREKVARKELKDTEKLKAALRDHILSFLDIPRQDRPGPASGEPLVILVVGVNGVGKTTTIGKASHHFRSQGKNVMLVAGDTFRAAAEEQLSIWGERVGADVVKQAAGADPSAVVFDALTAAISRKSDVVIIDTAGRLHTKTNLMEELKKIYRVTAKRLPGAPHEVWLVLDATTGQNAISQANLFNEAIGVTGIILTKLDGTAKGGIVVGISHQFRIPIIYIGIGEKVEDLRPFEPKEFVKAIFD